MALSGTLFGLFFFFLLFYQQRSMLIIFASFELQMRSYPPFLWFSLLCPNSAYSGHHLMFVLDFFVLVEMNRKIF